jgi:predicted ribonuclease YlaK
MNWKAQLVKESELQRLIEHNEPIPVNSGANLAYNSGVELFTIAGDKFNAIYDANLKAIRKLNSQNPKFSAMPNRDLLLYNDHLLDKNINTVIVDGFFGTGKTSTVCSHLVTGLTAALEGQKGIPLAYISKPHESLGKSYGHLPGELENKAAIEFQSFTQYFDRFGQPFLAEVLTGKRPHKGKIITPMMEIMVFEYLRGRDIETGWVILDEAQNTNRSEMASFVSRVGDAAKLIVLGDSTPTQIDKKGVSDGLSFLKETFKDKKYAGFVEMQSISHILRGQRVRDLHKALKSG